ncbi:uncharacterized protein LOC127871671 [Dreissena polymorpha]|uniref:Methyltransferase type 11 domain-containing protein n=1 Tax=Dreissena polymorpha TaxID=45954 RepID=A0A9D4R9N1_DREPO|nr:uncharacterized protein LOC127871671 [Dreissena polymorpha]KAH3858737.1 hypothetical protein DPMN_101365 [Dreissena polymorpha]
MPLWFNIDHRYLVLGAFGVTAGIAVYSTYQLKCERKRRKQSNVYESQKLVNEYLVFHYGSPSEVLRYEFGPKDSLDFPRRCAELCFKHYKPSSSVPSRAFDIGCAVGRSSFELTQKFDEVVGLDYSHAFVDMCNTLKVKGQMEYFVQDEGDLFTHLTAKVPANLARSKTSFIQGDACNLPTNLGTFGCVLAANLICRLHLPFNFLDRMAGLVAPGGILVITSPYTWMEQFTDKSTWLGGYQNEAGNEVTGFDTLKKSLGGDFYIVEDIEMPFFIRETAHKNQWSVAHATVWKRKS